MTAQTQQPAAGMFSEKTRTLLRVIILFLIAGAAIASRLFSVIRELSQFGMPRGAYQLDILDANLWLD